MKIYEMKITTERQGLFGNYGEDEISWTLNPTENAEIVSSDEDCKNYDTLYAIEHNVNNMKLKTLLKIIYEELNIKEINILFTRYPKLEQFFIAYLSCEKIREEISILNDSVESAESSARSAHSMATLSFLT